MQPPIPTLSEGELSAARILKRLEEKGAVLLRGYDLTLEEFEALTRWFSQDFHTSATRAHGRQMQGDSYSTEVVRHTVLFGHTESTYRPYPAAPELCFFLCDTPPAPGGGATTVIDGRMFLARLPAALREKLAGGITYEMLWERERWQNEFHFDTEAELTAMLDDRLDVRYTLAADGTLHLFYTAPAITRDRGGQEVFATAMLAHLPEITHERYLGKPVHAEASNRVYFASGEPVVGETLHTLIDIHDGLLHPHGWQPGDILVLDNTRVLHGRQLSAPGCTRRLFSRFTR